MDLSIITVTHNDSENIARQLASVKKAINNIQIEQWVVDNGSTDGTIEIIEKNFSDIFLIKNQANEGFGRANNMAARQAKGEFILFLNPDMVVMPGSLDKIVDWMRQNPEAGIVSCKLIKENGDFNDEAKPRRFPGLCDQLAIIFKLHHLFPGILNKYLYKDFNPEEAREVDSVRGSFMLMRKSFINEIGHAFDPRYFIWFEDVDICRECWKKGFKVIYTPIISCVDFVGQSFKKKPTVWKQKNFTLSMLQYFKKWEPWYKWIWIAMARPFGIFLAVLSNFR
jgi:hypothetical protein